MDQTEKQAVWVATEQVETRIAMYLIECFEKQKNLNIVLPMTRKDLASYLGTTPETISRKLAELETQKLLKQIRSKIIQILDLEGLRAL